MKIKNVPLHELKPYENNVKQHPVTQLNVLVESIRDYGFRGAILIDKNNVIVAGHARYEAASVAGLTEIPCEIIDDLSEEKIRQYRYLDNKISEMGFEDQDKLKIELAKMPNLNLRKFGIELPKFKTPDLKEIEEENTKEENDKLVTCPSCEHRFIIKE